MYKHHNINFSLSSLLVKQLKLLTGLILVLFAHFSFGQSIDIGIFESTLTTGQMDIKIRPDYDIADDETITAILYTVRWNDPLITISTEFIFPFFIAPQGTAVEYNGYYYQVFAAVPVNALAFMANQEFIASSFTYTDGECAQFEIIEDDWTQANNGNVYFEFLGENVTGIIYEPFIIFGSIGGFIDGGGTINLGESTGILTISDYAGNINSWQKRFNEGIWSEIPLTSGLVSYSETPSSAGLWEYRCEVQQGACQVDYSQAAQIIVLDTITDIPEIEQKENTVKILSVGRNIQLRRLNSEMLKGITTVYNITGQKIFEKNISRIKTFNFKLDVHGIFIITFFDEISKKMYKEKVVIK